MDEKTLTALEGSIEKWEKIACGTGEDLQSDNCPLCQVFLVKNFNCSGCPVYEKTGTMSCENSPYDVWRFLTIHYSTRKAINPVMVAAAQEMVEFLKGLLPSPFDINDFYDFPFKYIKITGDCEIQLDERLVEYFKVPAWCQPLTSLGLFKDFINLLYRKYEAQK
jgi:hypothetical protein